MRTKRIIGLIVLGCILGSLALLAGLISWLGAMLGIVVGVVIATVLVGSYVLVVSHGTPLGATDDEVRRAMPGDDLLRPDAPSHDARDHDRRVAGGRLPLVAADRVRTGSGWYSYDWIDNDGKPSVERIDPALQRLAVGDRIEMLPGFGPVVREIVPNHHILCGGEMDSWCLLVEPTPDGRTRLISRWRQDWPKSVGTYVWIAYQIPGPILMERKMLRRIRDLAERDRAAKRGHPSDHAEPRSLVRR